MDFRMGPIHSLVVMSAHLGPESYLGQDPLKSIFTLSSSALEALINFAYNGHLAIDQQNVQSLLMGASFLQLQSIKDACCTFLRERWDGVVGLARGGAWAFISETPCHFTESLECMGFYEGSEFGRLLCRKDFSWHGTKQYPFLWHEPLRNMIYQALPTPSPVPFLLVLLL